MSQLLVLNASAGSGKTFRLVAEYVALALQSPDYFKHILAVTFTNKATAEMKERVVKQLFLLASDKESKYLPFLKEQLGLNEFEIREKAIHVLSEILHHYSYFSVSTIDHFFYRIFRSFIHELGIKSNLKLALSHEDLLIDAIDDLLENASHNNHLKEWLIHFASNNLDAGKNWNFEKEIFKLGNEAFSETFFFLDNSQQELISDPVFMLKYQENLEFIKIKLNLIYTSFGKKAIKIIQENGYEQDDFSYGGSGIYNFFAKTADGLPPEPGKRVNDCAEDSGKWSSKSNPKRQQIINLAEDQLIPLLLELLKFTDAYIRVYNTIVAINKNFNALGILSDLIASIRKKKDEKELLLLSETPRLLQTLLLNDVNFVFEKTGTFYHHFMIDEFQDTSQLQWANFKPLFEESLSYSSSGNQKSNKNLVVGDVKQAIYRWRNGDWKLLAHDVKKDFIHFCSEENLDTNYRSLKNIVGFNNALFEFFPDYLTSFFENEYACKSGNIALAYQNFKQKCAAQELFYHGFVSVQQLNNNSKGANNFIELSLTQVKNQVDALLNAGFRQNDIALLVRDRKETKLLADYLLGLNLEHQKEGDPYRVISGEALYLNASPSVRLLLSCFAWLDNASNQLSFFEMLWEYHVNIAGRDPKLLMDIDLKIFNLSCFYAFFPPAFITLLADLKAQSVNELVPQLIQIFGVFNRVECLAYLSAFQDVVAKMANQGISNPGVFLEWWNNTGFKNAVVMPENSDAIQILTIHKSKGLQFKAVLIPFCTWEMDSTRHKQIFWGDTNALKNYSVDDSEMTTKIQFLSLLRKIPLNYDGGLDKTVFRDQFLEEKIRNYIDNLNLLYVALTRAEQVLYINIYEKGGEQALNVSQLLNKALDHNVLEKYFPDIHKTELEYGKSLQLGLLTKIERVETEVEEKPELLVLKNLGEYLPIASRLHIREARTQVYGSFANEFNGYDDFGNTMHRIYEQIRVPADAVKAVRKAWYDGLLPYEKIGEVLDFVEKSLAKPEVQDWFSEKWLIKSENSILLPGSVQLRPDRVLISANLCLVIDYKFTRSENPKHVKQVAQYLKILKDMGYNDVKGYLWYVILDKIENVEF